MGKVKAEMASDAFVVKAQISLYSSTGDKECMLYDSDRKFNWQGPADKEMVKAIGDKSYWWVYLDTNQMINLSTKASEDEYDQFTYTVMNGGNNG